MWGKGAFYGPKIVEFSSSKRLECLSAVRFGNWDTGQVV